MTKTAKNQKGDITLAAHCCDATIQPWVTMCHWNLALEVVQPTAETV